MELKREPLMLATVAVHGRKLGESLVARMLLGEKKKYERSDYDGNVEALWQSGVIAPWSAAYFHTLRKLGNESVHYRKDGVLGIPGPVGDADVVAILAAMLRVASIYEEWARAKAKG